MCSAVSIVFFFFINCQSCSLFQLYFNGIISHYVVRSFFIAFVIVIHFFLLLYTVFLVENSKQLIFVISSTTIHITDIIENYAVHNIHRKDK